MYTAASGRAANGIWVKSSLAVCRPWLPSQPPLQWTVPLPVPPGHCPTTGPLPGLCRPFCSICGEPHTVPATRATSVKSQRNACLTETNFQGEVRHGRKTEKARGLLETSFANSGPGCSSQDEQGAGSHWEVSLNKSRSGEGASPGCLQRAGAKGRGSPLGLGQREQRGGAAVWELGSVGPGSPLRQLHTGVGGSPHVLPDFLLPSTWVLLDSLHRRFSFLESSSYFGAPTHVTASGRTFLHSLPALRDPSPRSVHTCWRVGGLVHVMNAKVWAMSAFLTRL